MISSKNFDYITLEAFLKENSDFLLNSRLQKIQQPTRQDLIFSIRNKGESKKLYININPKFFHLCFMGVNGEQKRRLEIPKHPTTTKNGEIVHKAKHIYPPMFCMLLRKYLEGTKIAKVNQPQNERILEFYFETYNEIGEKIYLCLAIELMGKHSNVVLYNYDTNVIIGCMHNVGSDKSRERELIGGLPYTYPPKGANRAFSGFSELLENTYSVNQNIDDYFANLQEQEKIKSIKSKLLAGAKNKLKKVNSAMEKIEKQSTSTQKATLYRKKGDLIMSNLFNNKDFVKSIEVIDYETNLPLKIELDKTKTLKENANQYYKLYNKAKTANLKTSEMAENLQMEKEYLEQVLYSIKEAKNIEDLFEIDEDAKTQGCKDAKQKHTKIKNNLSTLHPFNLSTQKQLTVFVGKNNKQNDYIVSKLARDEDIWFHTHNCAGSHVLLRVEAGQKITDEIIFECAKLAKEHSSAKLSSKVGVIYTKAKNLKKPPKSPLGYVTYKNEKEIIID